MSNTNTIPTWEELQTSYKKFDYSDSTIERDRRTYLGFIKDYCQKSLGGNGIEMVTNAIAAAKDDFQNGLISRNRYICLVTVGYQPTENATGRREGKKLPGQPCAGWP